MAVKLYGANVCPFVHRVRLLLAEKSIEHDYVAIDLRNKPDWYHDVLPTGRVPLLEHNEHKIWESAICCEYLEEVFRDPGFMPEEPAARAHVRLAIDWISSKFVPLFYRFMATQDEEERKKHRRDLEDILKELDQKLGEKPGPYFFDELTLADFELYPWFERWCVLEHYRDYPVPTELENIQTWLGAMRERDSVKELAEPDQFYINQYSVYAEGKKTPS